MHASICDFPIANRNMQLLLFHPFLCYICTVQMSVEHIKRLVEEDEKHDLKLAPHLKAGYLELNHFDKMSVSSATSSTTVWGSSHAAACQDGGTAPIGDVDYSVVRGAGVSLVHADDIPLHWHGNELLQGDIPQSSYSFS